MVVSDDFETGRAGQGRRGGPGAAAAVCGGRVMDVGGLPA